MSQSMKQNLSIGVTSLPIRVLNIIYVGYSSQERLTCKNDFFFIFIDLCGQVALKVESSN